ncbi:hypothetical protein K474DRAFT_1695170 [Panus rudis PR-1116 ss-1]|nr:hypothetical protein K474DRAFT_1695170 [Panus rudis PR-1116 ss-1]
MFPPPCLESLTPFDNYSKGSSSRPFSCILPTQPVISGTMSGYDIFGTVVGILELLCLFYALGARLMPATRMDLLEESWMQADAELRSAVEAGVLTVFEAVLFDKELDQLRAMIAVLSARSHRAKYFHQQCGEICKGLTQSISIVRKQVKVLRAKIAARHALGGAGEVDRLGVIAVGTASSSVPLPMLLTPSQIFQEVTALNDSMTQVIQVPSQVSPVVRRPCSPASIAVPAHVYVRPQPVAKCAYLTTQHVDALDVHPSQMMGGQGRDVSLHDPPFLPASR